MYKRQNVGWGDPLTATASVSVYYVDGDTIREFSITTVSYSEMLLTDFDSDNIKELFVLQAAQTSGEEIMALGGLYRFDGDQPCHTVGRCLDCRSKSRGCNALLVLWGQMMDMAKVEVVLIDEPLGL